MAMRRIGVCLLSAVLVGPSVATAQWIELPLPGMPRTADGKPNLKAPAPRTAAGKPDLSGIWKVDSAQPNENLLKTGEAPMQPWAADLYRHRVATMGFERPGTRCMPHGAPDAVTVPNLPFKIVQIPSEVIILFEEFHKYRQIHTDGRSLPVDPDPAWYGYSIGKWEGDTFVVETSGFRGDGSWLDNSGHPHTDALKLTERFRRVNFGQLELDVTIDDPKAYTRAWKADTIHFNLQPDTELLEHLCESNKDLQSLHEYWTSQDPAVPSTQGR